MQFEEPSPCIYVIQADKPPALFWPAQEVLSSILAFHRALTPLGSLVTKNYGLEWSKVLSTGVLDYSPPEKYRRCQLVRALGYRVWDKWAIAAQFTNHSAGVAVKYRGIWREVIAGGESNFTRAVPLRKVFCGPLEQPAGTSQNGTGMLTTPTGIVSWSHFPDGSSRPKDLKTSPSIVQALERSEFEKAMVEDSDSFSGLSILFLPSILALLPIAAFQDASMVATNLYAVATDIVRAMPIVIKGIELAVCGSRRHYAFNANMYGVQNSTGAAEIWAAFCAMKHVRSAQRHRIIFAWGFGYGIGNCTRGRCDSLC